MILSGGIPVHAGRFQGFETNNSGPRFEQDLADMREYRGSLDFAQWRISAWEVRVLPTNNALPVGNLLRLLYAVHVRSNVPDPRFLSARENMTQFSEEAGRNF